MKVAIVKYNAGNVRSVQCALGRLGVEAEVTADVAMLPMKPVMIPSSSP